MIQSAISEPHLWSAFSHIAHLPSHLQWAQEWGRCPWWTNSWLWGENTKMTEDSPSFKWPDSKLVASLYCYQVTKQMKSRRSNKVILCYSSIEDEYEQVFCVTPLMMNTNLKKSSFDYIILSQQQQRMIPTVIVWFAFWTSMFGGQVWLLMWSMTFLAGFVVAVELPCWVDVVIGVLVWSLSLSVSSVVVVLMLDLDVVVDVSPASHGFKDRDWR